MSKELPREFWESEYSTADMPEPARTGPDAPSEPPNTFKQVVVGVLAQRYSPIHRQTEEILTAHEADKARAVREARRELAEKILKVLEDKGEYTIGMDMIQTHHVEIVCLAELEQDNE